MKKSDLKTGMVVEVRNGEKYLVMLNPDCVDRDLISFSGGFMELSTYDDNLTDSSGDDDWDIVKVYRIGANICWILSNKDSAMQGAELIWERTEEPVEMTIAEIEKRLGVKNLKIVKGDK